MSRIQKWLDSLQEEVIKEEDCQKVKDLYRSSNYTKTLTELISCAKAGGYYAQYALGLMYADGDGVRQDDVKAVRWFHLAAEAKYAPAQYNLGEMYDSGRGVAKDYKEAVRWYKFAVSNANAEAAYKLGMMYETGEGVPQDYKEAVQFYKRAMRIGNADAAYKLGVMYADGIGVQQGDMEEAEKYYQHAAKKGHAAAQNKVGKKYLGLKNYQYAYAWFNLAAAQGHEEAKKNRDSVVKHMTYAKLIEAQDMSWQFSTEL